MLNDEVKKIITKLQKARKELMERQPFYAVLLFHVGFSLDENCETAYTDGEKIVFCPDFINSLTDNELQFVLMHEVLHIALDHCGRTCREYDYDKFNIACDIVVNSNILYSSNMDVSSITLREYGESMHSLPDGTEGYLYTAEQIYGKIIELNMGGGENGEKPNDDRSSKSGKSKIEANDESENDNKSDEMDSKEGEDDSDESDSDGDTNESPDSDGYEKEGSDGTPDEADDGDESDEENAEENENGGESKDGKNGNNPKKSKGKSKKGASGKGTEESKDGDASDEEDADGDEGDDGEADSEGGKNGNNPKKSRGKSKKGASGKGTDEGDSDGDEGEDGEADSEKCDGKSNGTYNGGSASRSDKGFDDHTYWRGRQNTDEEDGGGYSDSDVMREEWLNRMAEAVEAAKNFEGGNGCGFTPLCAQRIIEELTKPKTDWKTLLHDFVEEEITDYSFNPPDRRFSDSPFLLPDFNDKDDSVKDVLFMIDASGSMSDEMITEAYSEIYGAIEQFNGRLQGWLGFFDAEVTEPKQFTSEEEFLIIRPEGGGGTSFECIFEYVKERMEKEPSFNPMSIIILTDGFAPFPDESAAMGIPVLWMINNEEVTPPWGKVARIPFKE